MESKRGQKLSKATVATVLAASGVIVAMPQPSHAYSFEDLNPLADYYEPVLDLANRKIATGYSDGTFKPNQAITREDAAKMLALTIDVNITNPKNPGFKDVTTSNPNYRYIAALAELGIINGYSDKTFKPKEPITRGQMAKILTLGFKFGVSTKLNHGFKDVSNKNANSYFIQTLYDLNVTKGKTPIAFDPFNTVTRGQMATFIWRAEKADRGNPVYAVGDVIGDQIYINGVPHTIASHLRSILSAANKNILKDAQIEGDFSGNRINNISKLTINASGTSSRLLAMDGNYTSFSGELVVNGSYVRFKNITFTGRVELAEAPRRSLADLSNMRVASVGNFAQFIDWSKPTVEKNEDFLNPIDKENLVDKPDPTKPNSTYKDRMSNLKKYVDFESSDIRHLYVTAERTFLKTDYEIDRLYVQGNVANFELYASPNAMYIDTDYNVNIYGVHDIRYVYKNTLKNVHLRSDATYDNYYITSSNGFTNIGEHTYITNAIIPPNKTVNDVFDDFETDEPQIGHIEDENGKEVSRDPVGDTVIKDVTAPRITDLRVSAGGTLADVSLTADEDGTYYYVVKRADEKAPTINEIKTGGTKHSGNGPIVMDEPVKFQVTGLDTKIDYVIYAIVIDAADNVSEKETAEFSTIDNKPPTMFLKPSNPQPAGGKRLEFTFEKISEPGTIYYYVRPASRADGPTIDEIIKNPTATIPVTSIGDITESTRIYGTKSNTGPIEPNTEYDVYAVMVDKTGNKMRTIEEKIIKSAVPDEEYPYLISKEMTLDDAKKGYFYIQVNEELDKETAENPANYTLSGSGIVTIFNKPEIQPSEVIYSNKRIRLTIPSISSLVNNDTIRVTVSKNVLDLAENEFENIEVVGADEIPRNTATYIHGDTLKPDVKINDIVTGRIDYEVNVNANKAGMYYYMILPKDYIDKIKNQDILSRDFVNEITGEEPVIGDKFSTKGEKDYLNISPSSTAAEVGDKKLLITKPTVKDTFTDYYLFMVLKDRNGRLSDIVWKQLIDDAKPPLISNVDVKPTTNTEVNVSLETNEEGIYYALPIRKYIIENGVRKLNLKFFTPDGKLKDITNQINSLEDKEERLKKFESLATDGNKIQDFSINTKDVANFTLKNLDPHEEYGMYLGVRDAHGNFTVQLGDKNSPNINNEPDGKLMAYYFYTDGIAPHITSQIISRKGDPSNSSNQTTEFTITFNEAIMRKNDINDFNKSIIAPGFDLSKIMEIKGASSTENLASKFAVESYTVGSSTTAPSTLVISTSDAILANQTLTVTMDSNKGNAYDYVEQNAFDISKIGNYYWPGDIKNTFWGAELVQWDILGTTKYSKSVKFGVKYDIALGRNTELNTDITQTLYFAVISSNTIVTAADIISAYNGNVMNGVQEVGKKVISRIGVSDVETLTIEGDGVFTGGDRIAAFTIDNFGNIVWLYDGTNKFTTIAN